MSSTKEILEECRRNPKGIRFSEFPSLSWLAPTPSEALAGIQELVKGVLADMRETGESPPEPLVDRT